MSIQVNLREEVLERMNIAGIDAEFNGTAEAVLRAATLKRRSEGAELLTLNHLVHALSRTDYVARQLEITGSTESLQALLEAGPTDLDKPSWDLLEAAAAQSTGTVTVENLWKRVHYFFSNSSNRAFVEAVPTTSEIAEAEERIRQEEITVSQQQAIDDALGFGPEEIRDPRGRDTEVGNGPEANVNVRLRLLATDAEEAQANELIDDLEDGIKRLTDLELPEEVIGFFEREALPKLNALRHLLCDDAPNQVALPLMASSAREEGQAVRGAFDATYGFFKNHGSPTADLALKAKALWELINSIPSI
ncbi:MAG: hypothetical protein HOE75_13155 [Chloroflexi bacterium]|jgi:hypothetical protein|nr:hypothetical protein [Chloroflexota bacterium]MBT5318284.1 hypothetical protein [Chloroflexota bacterium]